MNLTVTVKLRKNEPKKYIFANFDPDKQADFIAKSGNNLANCQDIWQNIFSCQMDFPAKKKIIYDRKDLSTVKIRLKLKNSLGEGNFGAMEGI